MMHLDGGMPRLVLLRCYVLFFTLSVAAEADEPRPWNEFRGSGGSGVAAGCRPPIQLDPERAAWKAALPAGQSSPIVAGDLVVTTAVRDQQLWTIALHKQTGRVAWQKQAPQTRLEKVHESSSPATSTPCSDDERVYVYFGSFGLLCYDLAGNEVWRKPIDTPKSLYGMSSSPILFGDLLIMVIDDDANLPESQVSRSKIIALNKLTGETVWETARPFHRSGWSTPTIWHHSGGSELVVLGNARARGYDARTGEERWYVGGFSRETIARPIVGQDVVYVSASMIGGVADDQPDPEPFWQAVLKFDANGDQQLQHPEMTETFTFPFRPHLPPGHPGFGMPLPKKKSLRQQRLDGMFGAIDQNKDGNWSKAEFLSHISFNRGKPNLKAIRPGGAGDIAETHVEWSLHRGIPEIPSPIFFDERIYLISDGGVLTVVDARDGNIVYRKRIGAAGHYRASPIIAAGHLYVVSEPGVLSVIRTGDEFELVHQCDFGGRVAATPAIAENTLYLRAGKQLFAFRNQP